MFFIQGVWLKFLIVFLLTRIIKYSLQDYRGSSQSSTLQVFVLWDLLTTFMCYVSKNAQPKFKLVTQWAKEENFDIAGCI
jgi:hypothetical protein